MFAPRSLNPLRQLECPRHTHLANKEGCLSTGNQTPVTVSLDLITYPPKTPNFIPFPRTASSGKQSFRLSGLECFACGDGGSSPAPTHLPTHPLTSPSVVLSFLFPLFFRVFVDRCLVVNDAETELLLPPCFRVARVHVNRNESCFLPR